MLILQLFLLLVKVSSLQHKASLKSSRLTGVMIASISRYMNGAATNPDAHVVAYAAAQVKKGLEIAKKLGAENFGKYVRSLFLYYC